MQKIKIVLGLLSVLIVLSVSKASAQANNGDQLDKIVAVVGNEMITQSDVMGYLTQMAMSDKSIDPSNKDLQKKALDMLINEKLVIAKAVEDSMTASDDEIKQRWDFQISRFIQRYGSEKRIEDIYGMSVKQMENEFKEDIRKQILSDKIKEKEFGEIKVNQREVEEFFKSYKDSLPDIPAQIELYHIVKNVDADKKAKEQIYSLAKLVRDSILKGADFAEMAKRYSGDPGTAASGGDLGWFNKGKFFQEFETAAFALQKGAISMPVETPFGYHLIQTMDKNKDSIHTRHILFRLSQTNDQVEKVKAELLELKKKAESGMKFEDLAKEFSDEKETQGFGGLLGRFTMDQIPENIKDDINKLAVGQISNPLIFSASPKLVYHIIYKKRLIVAHKADFKDDFRQIEQMALSFKQNKLYNEWIEKLRKEMYWEVKN